MSKFGRDIALAIQLTKIPEASAAPRVVPGPGGGTWPFLDTFTGTGALSAHISDSGHLYFLPVGMELVDGELRLVTNGDFRTALPAVTPPGVDYFVEATVRVPSTMPSADFRLGLHYGVVGQTEIHISVPFSEFDSPSKVAINFGAWEPASAIIPDSTFTIRLEVVGTAITAFMNGAIWTFDDAFDTQMISTIDEATEPGLPHVVLSAASAADLGVLSFSAGDL